MWLVHENAAAATNASTPSSYFSMISWPRSYFPPHYCSLSTQAIVPVEEITVVDAEKGDKVCALSSGLS